MVKSFVADCHGYDCTNGALKEVTSYDNEKDCIRTIRYEERMRQGIGYWWDPVRYECRKETR